MFSDKNELSVDQKEANKQTEPSETIPVVKKAITPVSTNLTFSLPKEEKKRK